MITALGIFLPAAKWALKDFIERIVSSPAEIEGRAQGALDSLDREIAEIVQEHRALASSLSVVD
jgi:hypothetical protein